jgi:arabinofuranosyltransferase
VAYGQESSETDTPKKRSFRGSYYPTLLLLSLTAIIGFAFWGFSHDDVFVTYRYAKRWVATGEFSFNPGSRVLGTTAPGYGLLLGFLDRFLNIPGLDVPHWGTLTGLFSLVVAALLLQSFLRGADPLVQSGVTAVFSILSFTLRWNVEMLGGETLPAMAFSFLGLDQLFRKRRPVLAGFFMAVAICLRFESVLAAASAGLVVWTLGRRFPLRFALTGLLPVTPYLYFLVTRFGTIVPNTLAVRSSEFQYVTTSYTLSQWGWLVRCLTVPGAVCLLVLASAGVFRLLRAGLWRHRILLAITMWLIFLEATYRILRVPFAPWYHEATVTVLTALAAYAAVSLPAELLKTPWLLRRRALREGLVIGSAFVLCATSLVPSLRFVVGSWKRPPDPRCRIYTEAAEWIRDHSRKDDVIAVVEIGFVSYYSDRPVLDLMGLTDREVVGARRAGTLPLLFQRRAPRFLIDNPVFGPIATGPILARPWVRDNYRLRATCSAPDYGVAIRILEREVSLSPEHL